MTDLETIAYAALDKFGPVLSVIQKPDKSYKLTIRRNQPADEAAPYMKITGYMHEKSDGVFVPAFCYGHYDLTREQAMEA